MTKRMQSYIMSLLLLSLVEYRIRAIMRTILNDYRECIVLHTISRI
jgi:hypothetical protein